MSDTENFGFGKFVPGFDFLQNLTKSANASNAVPKMPNMGGWIAPTMNVEDLDKRIEELKTVQFWLDQNAVALKATIQALEVQKMTLATLKGMNVSMADMAKAFTVNNASASKPVKKSTETAASHAKAPVQTVAAPAPAAVKGDAASAERKIDPMQWWDSLTQQFQQIATTVMKDVADKTAADNLAKENKVKNTLKAAVDLTALAAKTAADAASAANGPAQKVAKKVAQTVAKTVTKTAVKAAAKKIAK